MADAPQDQQPSRRATDIPEDAPWWAKWLDANIREAWKWGSMWWPAFCAAIMEVYAQDPKAATEFLQGILPPSWWPHILAGGFVFSMVLRVLNLSRLKRKEQP